MAQVPKAQQQAFIDKLTKGGGAPLAALVFGNDTGGVQELGERLLRAVLGAAADDPMQVENLDDEMLKDDPGRLADEVQAISMFGGRRVVKVRNAGEGFRKAMQAVLMLPDEQVEAFIVALAPGLKKDAALARLFTKEKRLAALPVYADDARDVQGLIDAVLAEHGLRIERDARLALAHMLGGDRLASRNELEKLALYCRGQERITLADVQAVASDVSAHMTQDMLDAFFGGDATRGARLFQALLAEGMPGAAMLTAAANHVALLRRLRLAMSEGASAREAVEKARPPVFFKRREAIQRQLRAWTEDRLARADESIWQATHKARQLPDLEAELAERCLLVLALQAGRRQAA